MRIIIFGDNFSFPEGNAATNRVFTYAKGFIENDVKSYVICFRNDYYLNGNGTIDGIPYFHPLNQKEKSKSFLKRNWFKMLKYRNTLNLVRKINKEGKVDAIITYTKETPTHLFSWLLSRIIGAKLIIENSEHPLRYYKDNFFQRQKGNLKLWIELSTFDGILLITQQLIDLYKTRLKSEKKLLLVPSTVDPSRFRVAKSNTSKFEYIGYFGSINFERDNVDLLINAFALIHKKYPDLHLVLGGMYGDNEKKMLTDLISSLKIESSVNLLKYLSREEIIRYMVDARIIVLVRSNDPDTNASFPCKLTEYLSTGNPVISVSVSEIPIYLTDSKDIFLTEPGNVKELSEKLEYVLDNYEFATDVAHNGKELTNSVFNYNYQTKRIIEFIKSIN
jgi:glycosyltransferase involved in cell wall biosynthesis